MNKSNQMKDINFGIDKRSVAGMYIIVVINFCKLGSDMTRNSLVYDDCRWLPSYELFTILAADGKEMGFVSPCPFVPDCPAWYQ